MFNKHDVSRDACQLFGNQAKCGYDWWWHSFTGRDEEGNEKPFFIEFFVCNPAGSKQGDNGDRPVFGQLKENQEKGIKPSYLMVKAGAWGKDKAQLHNFYGWNEFDLSMSVPFQVQTKQSDLHPTVCYIDETKTYGKVEVSPEDAENHPEYMCDSGCMEWNLKIKKDVAFNVGYGAGALFRKLQAFEMFWHAEGMKTYYEGEVIWNGKKYFVKPDDCYGYADKNWGKDFTSPWVWLSSNNLVSKVTGKKLNNSVFDIGGGRPKVGPVALKRKLLSAYFYEGKDYEFNFSKFWTFCRTKFDCKETENQIVWHVEQKTVFNKMITDITCNKEDMLLVNYEAPNGKKLHNRLWNGGNGMGTVKLYHRGKLVDEVECKNVGCEFGEYC